ncbi:hypothetical protein ES695_20315 [Candidatus Atribacteria bacterium 1244-E10-H5-B2]|nr:MAG: hypothetical protein ES695_20315 [Candidatus Atribacteria bacterium 1244-E10-H5-B2]
MRCLYKYCKKEIPVKTTDSKGRKHTKKTRWCRGTRCYRLWYDFKNKKRREKYNHSNYLRLKNLRIL